MTDEELCAEYYRVAGDAADPCVDVAGLRAVADAVYAAANAAFWADAEAVVKSARQRADIAEARAAYWKAMVDREREAHRYRMTDGAEAETHWALVKKHEGEWAKALAKLEALGAKP